MNEINIKDLSVGMRLDGTPWRIRSVEIKGTIDGPRTAIVGGIWGDKPLATISLWHLIDILSKKKIYGSVVVIPAVNLPAMEVNSRVNPDHVYLNRIFPGSSTGSLTAQIAHTLFDYLSSNFDCVIDLHSGTSTMSLGYIYDYGDLELSSSFGFLPVILNMSQPGQLSAALVQVGVRSCLVEFGGAGLSDMAVGVAGCLNVLGRRGHIDDPSTGPDHIPIIENLKLYSPSTHGILGSHYSTTMIGCEVREGLASWVTSPGTGERLEEFSLEQGSGILLLANTTTILVSPGSFGLRVGYSSRSIALNGISNR